MLHESAHFLLLIGLSGDRDGLNSMDKGYSLLVRFTKEYSIGQLPVISMEAWLQCAIGWIPSLTGFFLRSIVYRLILNQYRWNLLYRAWSGFPKKLWVSLGRNYAINRGAYWMEKVAIGDNV